MKKLIITALFGVLFLLNFPQPAHAVTWDVDEYPEAESMEQVYEMQVSGLLAFQDEIRISYRIPAGDKRTEDDFAKVVLAQSPMDTENLYEESVFTSDYCSKPGKWLIVKWKKIHSPKAREAEAEIRKSEEKIKDVISEITSPNQSEYEKVSAIYSWITGNVSYDSTGEMESPADAVLYGKAICWGYATLFSRMCREVGVESMYVSSKTHGYNIVKVDGRWYYCDSTHDAGEETWRYFLAGEKELSDSHKTLSIYQVSRYLGKQ